MKALTRLYLTPATPETSDITPNIPRMLQPPPPKRQSPNLLQQHTSGIETMKIHQTSSHPMPSLAFSKSRLCARLLPEGHLEVHQGSEISGSPALYKLLGARSRDRFFGPTFSLMASGQCCFLNQNLGVWNNQTDPNRLVDVDWVNCELDSFVFVWPKL